MWKVEGFGARLGAHAAATRVPCFEGPLNVRHMCLTVSAFGHRIRLIGLALWRLNVGCEFFFFMFLNKANLISSACLCLGICHRVLY